MLENFRDQAYIEHVRRLEQRVDCKDDAMRLAVGGEFDAVGKLEHYLLRSLGLSSGQLIIDVGCGSGRLAQQLAGDKSIRYVGTDVVPRLLESAKASTGRNDWEFHLVEGIRIPCPDNVADFVTFFSVLTHTTHVESFKYLQEAARCLKTRRACDRVIPGVPNPVSLGNVSDLISIRADRTSDSICRSRCNRGLGRPQRTYD